MVEKRFRMLRLIASISRLISIIFLVLGVVGALLAGVTTTTVSNGASLLALVCWYPACLLAPAAPTNLIIILFGFSLFAILSISFFGAGEVLGLAIAIEENTRRSAFVLRMWLNTQPSGGPNPPAEPR